MAANGRNNRRRRRGNPLFIPVVFVLVFAALILGVGVFFRVRTIEVIGAGIYTEEEIIGASGLETGGSVFFVGESSAAAKIRSALPYVDKVSIIPSLPDTIRIEITESYPIASVEIDGRYWLIDKNGKLLEKTDLSGAEGTMTLKGVTPIQPVVGSVMALGEAGSVRLTYLKAVLSGILEENMQDDITVLDMTEVSDITFEYLERFTVHLGRGENVEDKLELLKTVVLQLENGDTGVINLSVENEASFKPD